MSGSESFTVTFEGPAIRDKGLSARALAESMQGMAGLMEYIAESHGEQVKLWVSSIETVGDSFSIHYRLEAA